MKDDITPRIIDAVKNPPRNSKPKIMVAVSNAAAPHSMLAQQTIDQKPIATDFSKPVRPIATARQITALPAHRDDIFAFLKTYSEPKICGEPNYSSPLGGVMS